MRIDKITSLGAAIIVVAGIGIGAASASTTSAGVKACVTSKGYLQVAKKTGHCPAHTKKVTIAKQGPRGLPGAKGNTGPQGPGAVALNINSFSGGTAVSKSAKLPSGDTVKVTCSVSAPLTGQLQVMVTNPSADDTSFVYGTGDIQNEGPGDGTISFGTQGDGNTFSDAHNALAVQSTGDWEFGFTTGGAIPGIVTAHLLVVRGNTDFTVDILGVSEPSGNPDTCVAGVQVTPTS